MRSTIPGHHRAFNRNWKREWDQKDRVYDEERKSDNYYNSKSKNHQGLKISLKVRIQDNVTKRWDRIGVIVTIGNYRNYLIKLPIGRCVWRNRRFINI